MNSLKDLPKVYQNLASEIGKAFFGPPQPLEGLICALSAGLHCLLEDLPGTGKTTLAKALAKVSGLSFQRIQFTPDLFPGDVLGGNVWNPAAGDFQFRPGLLGKNFILADEINRASPRTQAAFLEAMQEGQYTVEGVTRPLERPFFLLATQNPPSMSGTFPLPEAQVDRLALCYHLGYPDPSQALELMASRTEIDPLEKLPPLLTPKEWITIQDRVKKITVPQATAGYIHRLADLTRRNPEIRLGLSPRWTLHIQALAQARCAWQGREIVLPEDVKALALPSAAHRILLSPEAKLRQKQPRSLLEELWAPVPLPTGLR